MPAAAFREPTCPTCGSNELCCDAAARWNPVSNDWEKTSEFQDVTCDECGNETDKPVWVDITDPGRIHELLGARWLDACKPLAPKMLTTLQTILGELDRAKQNSARPSSGIDGMAADIRAMLKEVQKAQLQVMDPQHQPPG